MTTGQRRGIIIREHSMTVGKSRIRESKTRVLADRLFKMRNGLFQASLGALIPERTGLDVRFIRFRTDLRARREPLVSIDVE